MHKKGKLFSISKVDFNNWNKKLLHSGLLTWNNLVTISDLTTIFYFLDEAKMRTFNYCAIVGLCSYVLVVSLITKKFYKREQLEKTFTKKRRERRDCLLLTLENLSSLFLLFLFSLEVSTKVSSRAKICLSSQGRIFEWGQTVF